MKKIYNKTQQTRSFRRFVKKWFASFIKHQNRNSKKDLKKVLEMLERMEDSLEIIAKQVGRWARIEPGE